MLPKLDKLDLFTAFLVYFPFDVGMSFFGFVPSKVRFNFRLLYPWIGSWFKTLRGTHLSENYGCLPLRPWQTRTHCCGLIVAHDGSWAAQSGKHLWRTQNVSEQTQKHFMCPEHKIWVRNKCCARGRTGKHLCRQQCVRNNVSLFARAVRVNTRNFLIGVFLEGS